MQRWCEVPHGEYLAWCWHPAPMQDCELAELHASSPLCNQLNQGDAYNISWVYQTAPGIWNCD